jgi:hypothetical protein
MRKFKLVDKKVWAKGRKAPTLLVRLDQDIHQAGKEEAEKCSMTFKNWVSWVVRKYLVEHTDIMKKIE